MSFVSRYLISSCLSVLCLHAHAQAGATTATVPAATATPPSAAAEALRKVLEARIKQAEKDKEIVPFKDQDPAMRAAFKKAQATLDRFLKETRTPNDNQETVSVKVAIREGALTEYFWVTPFTRDASGQNFSGLVDGRASQLKHVQEDQMVHFKRADIVDWMYVQVKPRVMHGNYTTCVQAKDSPNDLAALKRLYGLDCALR